MTAASLAQAIGVPRARAQLSLFGGFTLEIADTRIMLPMHARRVLAYLALHKMSEAHCDRVLLAERLWVDSTGAQARASLRTAIWRIRRAAPDVVAGDLERISLADSVQVDVHEFRHQAEQLLSEGYDSRSIQITAFSHVVELLPGWDEDWLVLAREQLRLLRLHAMEDCARKLHENGQHPQAIDMILAVVDEEPLRESARAVLINAHLAAGNAAEARRQFDNFATELWDEMNLLPSPGLMRKVGLTVPPVRKSIPPQGARVASLP